MQQRSIIWQKWNDPLRPLLGGKQVEPYEPGEDEEDHAYQMARATWYDGEDDDDGEEDNDYEQVPNRGWAGPSVILPWGVVPMQESNLPSKLFNFWMGHTNFDLTNRIARAIEQVPGVEGLDIATRYRFRIAIGKHFNAAEVKAAIDALVQPKEEPEQEPEQVDAVAAMQRRLSTAYPFFAVVKLDKGQLQCVGGKSADEVREKAKRFADVAKETILSWEMEEC